jgi:predicted permease
MAFDSRTPPLWARRLARALISRADRAFLIDDLDDGYLRRRLEGRGALRWYLLQAVHAGLTRRPSALPLALSATTSGGSMLSTLRSDAMASLRSFRRHPASLAVVVLSLALGIGAASAMFTVVRGVLLRPLPYGDPDGIVTIWSRWTGFDKTWVSSQEVLDYRDRSRTLADVAAWGTGRVTLTGIEDATRVGAGFVTSNTFDVLRVRPIAGRTFTEDEATASAAPGGPNPLVISHGLWQRLFAGDPTAVGRKLELDGSPAEVLGVMPPGFRLPTDFGEDAAEPTDVWLPLSITPANAERGSHGLYAAARLADGATPAQAIDDLARITDDLTRQGEYPEEMRFRAIGFRVADDIFGEVRPSLLVLQGAVAFLMLIACANAAALLLARAESRQREFATRTALGASRWRLVRQQFVEGLLIAFASGGLGLGLALLANRALTALGPTAIPRATDVSVDWTVALFLVGACVVAALLCSLPPALRAFRVNVTAGLKDGSTQSTAGRSRHRLRHALVVAQVAMAVLLLAGAGLMLRSLWSLQRVPLGFQPSNVLTAGIALPGSPYDTNERVNGFYDTLLARVRQLPGVTAAGLMRSLPLGNQIGDWGLMVEGYTPPPGDNAKGDWQLVTPGAIEAMGERLVRGRLFTDADTAGSMPVALINETMASMYWEGQDPIGRRIRQGGPDRPWITIVGIVADLRHNGIDAPVKGKFYRPYVQFEASTGNIPRSGNLVVKTAGDPLSLAGPIRNVLRELDPSIPIATVRTMDSIVATSITSPRLTSSVLTSFAVVALVLAAIGIYSLLAFVVAERSHELGIRLAVGAGARDIVGLVLTQGVVLALVGVGAGLIAAAATTNLLASQLRGVSALDPATFVTAPLVLVGAAVVASLVPALRASRVDPVGSLRR